MIGCKKNRSLKMIRKYECTLYNLQVLIVFSKCYKIERIVLNTMYSKLPATICTLEDSLKEFEIFN